MSERPLLSPRLKDLPIDREDTYYGNEGDGHGIFSKYRAELAKVRSPKGLYAFVRGWRVLWLLHRTHFPNHHRVPTDLLLASGKFNAKKVWRTLRKMTSTYRTIRPRSSHWLCAASIRVPSAFIQGMIVAKHYGVPEDVALIQLYQGVEFF